MLEDSSAMLRETARRFATQRLAPNAARWDEESRCPNEVVTEMGRLGLLGMTIPEAWRRYGRPNLPSTTPSGPISCAVRTSDAVAQRAEP